jgi:cytochrome c oxidase assembly protein subunit 11
LGEKGITSYYAHNRLSKTTGGTALYNVSPAKAGIYFNKIQCFCFDLQTLAPGESVDMPVLFYVDPKMADDPDMADVSTITLSYTFYEASSKELEDALQGFYNGEPPPEKRASR